MSVGVETRTQETARTRLVPIGCRGAAKPWRAGCAWTRLGGRADLAIMAGSGAPCPEGKPLKALPTCLLRRFPTPGCRSATGNGCGRPKQERPAMSNTELKTGEIVSFPISGRARSTIAARKPRRSKNGAPEERAAKRSAAIGQAPSTVLALPRNKAASLPASLTQNQRSVTAEFLDMLNPRQEAMFLRFIQVLQENGDMNLSEGTLVGRPVLAITKNEFAP